MTAEQSQTVQAKVEELSFHNDRTNEVRGYVRDFERLVEQLHSAGSQIEQMVHNETVNPELREDVDTLEQIVNRFQQQVEQDQEAVREMENDRLILMEQLENIVNEGSRE